MTTVLHLIDTGGPGGAETLLRRLVADFAAAGHRNVVVISREGWLSERIRELGISPVILPSKGSFNVSYLRALLRLIRETRADLVFAHLYGSAIYGSIAGRLAGVPVVAILHGQSDVDPAARFAGLKAWAVRGVARRIVFVSRQLAGDLAARLGLSEGRYEVIENGIDVEAFQPGSDPTLRHEIGLAADGLLVGAIGNVRAPKAYDVLLDAARIVCDRNDRVRFVVAGQGDGALQDALLAQRERLGLADRFHFLGFRGDTSTVLRGLDVFVLSSRTEGFSIACLEAMACGVPVVATRSGGPEAIVVDGESGLLVSPGSPAALADAVLRLLGDPGLRQRLAAGGRTRVVEHFDERRMLARYRSLVDKVVAGS